MLKLNLDKKQNNIIKNKNIRMFLFFVLLSSMFWVLINLSKEYISDANVLVTYYNLPKSKIIKKSPKRNLKFELKAGGFKFLTYQLDNPKIKFNLAHLHHFKKDLYYYLPNNHLRELQLQFSSDIELLSVATDTIYIELTSLATKKVKVKPNLNIEFKVGYNLAKPIVVKPDSIDIIGPKSMLDSIDDISTIALNLKGLSNNIDKKLALNNFNNKLKFNKAEVRVFIEVDKFTETSIVKGFRVINIPKEYKINTIPKEVTVTYQVSLSNFNKVNANMFEIVCNFSETLKDSLNYLIPKIVAKPDFVNAVHISPDKIEYLLFK